MRAIVAILCLRTSVDAIALANEGDKIRGVNIDGAIEKYEAARTADPKNHAIQWKLATAYVKKEDWSKASDVLANACMLAPTFASYFFMHGYVLERERSWKEAKPALEKAIALDPNWSEPHYELGMVSLALGDERTAMSELSKAIELQPDSANAYAALADLYFRLGYLEHAEKTIAASTPFAPSDYRLFSLLGAVRMEKKDTAGAVTAYEKAKVACGQCNVAGQQLVFFDLGAAYALARRKSEAMSNLSSFYKIVCKGAAAMKYADQCTQAQQLVRDIGGNP